MEIKKVGITGQYGFVGRHLYNYLNLQNDIELITFERDYFEDESKLQSFVQACDIIVHLAAVNRHEDQQELHDINVQLVKKLIVACETTKSKPWILFSSSIQEEKDNLYGASKRRGRELLEIWANKNSAQTTTLVIPNVFGPFGKPFYNSVAATFCHQVATGGEPTIHKDGTIKLIYVNHLIQEIYSIIQNKISGKVNIDHQYELKVSELLNKLLNFKNKYIDKGEFPNITNPLELDLFNTFRCYIPADHYPRPYTKHTDDRGYFVEIVRANTSGQFSFSTTKPGITRGNHFHTRKAERFAVIKGKAQISIRKIDSEKVIDYIIDGNEPGYVDMPIWHTHNISNIGEEDLIALFWINEPYNAEDADTYYVNV